MICNLSSITIYRSNCTGLDASAEPSNISLGNNRVIVCVCVCVCVRCGCWHVTYKERAVDCHGLVEHHQCLIENHQLTSVNFFLGFLFLSKNIVYHHFSFYPSYLYSVGSYCCCWCFFCYFILVVAPLIFLAMAVSIAWFWLSQSSI